MYPNEVIALLNRDWCSHDGTDLSDAIELIYNADVVEVEPSGNVWIAEPMTGHYLDDDELRAIPDQLRSLGYHIGAEYLRDNMERDIAMSTVYRDRSKAKDAAKLVARVDGQPRYMIGVTGGWIIDDEPTDNAVVFVP